MQLYIVIISSLILVWGSYFFLSSHEKRHTEFMHRLAKFGIKSHFGHTEGWLWLERLLDKPVGEDEDSVEVVVKEMSASDQALFYDFLKGKSEVFVDDIKMRSGVNPDLVDGLVDEGIRNGSLEEVKTGLYGVPSIVTLKED